MPDNSCMTPQGFNENSRLRASDADRDQAATVINGALAEGRLTAEEHSERLDAIYAAKTQADLVPLLDDLPSSGVVPALAGASAEPLPHTRRGGRIIAIFGGATRKGGWHAEPIIDVIAVFGGVDLDFRDAVLPGNEVVLRATAILGGISVVVPPEMRVIDDGGVAILGGKDLAGSSAESVGPDAPVLRVQGSCVLGGIDVKRKDRKRKGAKDRCVSTADDAVQGALGQVRDQRRAIREQMRDQQRQLHDQMRDQHRQMHDQIREQHRQLRRGWTGDSDE
jgi:hypothetical protein